MMVILDGIAVMLFPYGVGCSCIGDIKGLKAWVI